MRRILRKVASSSTKGSVTCRHWPSRMSCSGSSTSTGAGGVGGDKG